MNSRRILPVTIPARSDVARRHLRRAAQLTTTAAVLASLAACGSSVESPAAEEVVGSTSQAVLGNEIEGSCNAADIPQIQRAFEWARVAVNSPAFEQCVSAAYGSFLAITPPNYNVMQIGAYNPCVGDPPTSSPSTIFANTLTPNPVNIKCDYSQEGTSEGGYANLGQVPLSDTTSRETITLGSVLGGIQTAAPSDDAYAQIAGTIMHEIMHQKGYNHVEAYNPGNACAAGLTPDELCGLPCSENPYYGSGIPYEVGECVRVVLEESMDHCSGMKTACGPSGLQLVSSVIDSTPTCGCVGDPASRSTIGVFRNAGAPFNGATTDMWILGDGAPGPKTTTFQYGAAGDVAVMGDWDGNGSVTPGIFRPAGSTYNSTTSGEWILSNDPAGVTALPPFYFGAPGDLPLVGDWDGDGTTTVGVFRNAGAPFNHGTTDMWILTNSPTGATALPSFQYGAAGDLPVVGDWDGDGTTTVGVFRNAGTAYNGATTDMWILTNSPTGVPALPSFQFGAAGDLPIVGDWDGNRTTTVGVFRNAGAPFNSGTTDMWILTNDPIGSSALPSFQFGAPGDRPVIGRMSRL